MKRKPLASIFSVRFDSDAAATVRRSAEAEGLTVSQFMRKAALKEAALLAMPRLRFSNISPAITTTTAGCTVEYVTS